MSRGLELLLHHLVILFFLFTLPASQAVPRTEKQLKTLEFLSHKVDLEPGFASNKHYYDMEFPKGHVAIKSFNGEAIDDKGNPIPIFELYFHHWAVVRFYRRKGLTVPKKSGGDPGFHPTDIVIDNSGLCQVGNTQYFGMGSETRRTNTYIPDPYGIEVGNPADIPDGYEEKWMLNVHAIDTRGVEDKMGCNECKCDLYNVTIDKNGNHIDEYGQLLPPGYGGGMSCCYDNTRCRVKEGYQGVKRALILKYTWKYYEWDASIIPVKIYMLDVTDEWTKADASRGAKKKHRCHVEYDVEACPAETVNRESCIHTKSATVEFPDGGVVAYAVAHLHAAGTGMALYGENGREICTSYAQYGMGHEAGNEAGYIVGMSSCYPSMKIAPGELVTLLANYSNTQAHTGVMGLFYILVADYSSKPSGPLHALAYVNNSQMNLAIGVFGIIGVVMVVMFLVRSNSKKSGDYEPLMA